MTKEHIIVAALLLIAVIAVGAIYSLNGGKTGTQGMPMGGMERNESGAPTTMKQLLGLGKDTKCTFSSVVNAASSEGVVYVSGGKMRGDFKSTIKDGTADKTMMSHMIVDADAGYVWSDGVDMGIKLSREMIDKGEAEGTTERSPLSMEEQVDYRCENWGADASYFVPPTNLKWNDMAQMMGGAQMPAGGMPTPSGAGTGGMNKDEMKAMQCAACDQAGEARDQCRAALSCN